MELVPPSVQYKDSFIAAVREYQADISHNKHYLELSIPDLEDRFNTYVEKEHSHARGENLPDGYVPATTWWLINNREFIGVLRIRHRLTEHLERIGGHIGCDIRPSKRRLGYGTKILELAIPKVRELGIKRILLTCDADNIGSRKIIERNGGVLQDQVVNPEGGSDKLRFLLEV